MLELFRNLLAPPRDLILIVAAAWLGLSLAEKRSAGFKVSVESLNNLIFAGLLAYILGGRIIYAAEHLSAFEQSPLGLISLNITLFDGWGALAAAAITGLAYIQRKGLSIWAALDALTLFFATLAIGLGLSHLASGAAFGQETSLPWAINIWGASRHPTQLYEIIASTLILCLLWSRKAGSKPGSEFLLFIALAAASRLVIEGFRGDSLLIFGNFRAAQLAAWFVLAIALSALEFPRPQKSAMTGMEMEEETLTPVTTESRITTASAKPKKSKPKTGQKNAGKDTSRK